MSSDSPRRKRIARGLGGTVAVLAVALAAAPALAKPRFESTLTINLEKGNPAHAFGHVRSDKPTCKSHRYVILMNETAGERIGHFVTRKRGTWRLEIPKHLKSGGQGHFVDLSARVLPRKTPHLVCGRARSGTIPVSNSG